MGRAVRALRSLGAGVSLAPAAAAPAQPRTQARGTGSAGDKPGTPGLAAKSAAKPKGPTGDSDEYTYETVTEQEEEAAEKLPEEDNRPSCRGGVTRGALRRDGQ